MNRLSLLVLGARSDIGLAIAHRFAKEGYDIQLAARNSKTLENDKSDIELRYHVSVSLHEFDALQINSHELFVNELPCLPAIAVCAVGLLTEQKECETDISSMVRVIRSNFEGPSSIMAILANRFEKQGHGSLVGISSVAGDRGRASNYAYGSAKSGFTQFLSGLRNRLSNTGVRVITILPGFVATKMTEGLQLPAALTATPKEVAEAVFNAVERKKDVIYVKSIWRIIMLIIRNIPEAIFKRSNI